MRRVMAKPKRPFATSWHIKQVPQPDSADGAAVLPVLHLNGYKNRQRPACWPGRIGHPGAGRASDAGLRLESRCSFARGMSPEAMHQRMGRGVWIRRQPDSWRSASSARRSGEAVRAGLAMIRCCAPQGLGRAPANCMQRNWRASGARTRLLPLPAPNKGFPSVADCSKTMAAEATAPTTVRLPAAP